MSKCGIHSYSNAPKVQSCGSCKWLDMPPEHRKKDGTAKERYRYRVYYCKVPFEMPKLPSSYNHSHGVDRNMMAPYYGNDCAFHTRCDATHGLQGGNDGT